MIDTRVSDAAFFHSAMIETEEIKSEVTATYLQGIF